MATGLKSSTTNFIGQARAAFNPRAPLIGITPLEEVLGHRCLDMRKGRPIEAGDAEIRPSPVKRFWSFSSRMHSFTQSPSNFPRTPSDECIHRTQSGGTDAAGPSSRAHGNQSVNAMSYKEMTAEDQKCDTSGASSRKELVPAFANPPKYEIMQIVSAALPRVSSTPRECSCS